MALKMDESDAIVFEESRICFESPEPSADLVVDSSSKVIGLKRARSPVREKDCLSDEITFAQHVFGANQRAGFDGIQSLDPDECHRVFEKNSLGSQRIRQQMLSRVRGIQGDGARAVRRSVPAAAELLHSAHETLRHPLAELVTVLVYWDGQSKRFHSDCTCVLFY
jgi:hypothetical protein